MFIIVFAKVLLMKFQPESDQTCTKPRTLLHKDPFFTHSSNSLYTSVHCLFHAGYQFFLQIPSLGGVILSLPNAQFLIFGLC